MVSKTGRGVLLAVVLKKALRRGRALECVMGSEDQALASRSITQGRPCFLRLTKPGW
jgi:hypothetical protein